ncbi:hypothetical protein AKJ56_00515 [candidate division MSBL1 archaeon SCGC-AAA382N08]|uniref:Uncharacterized protein n=1 Tax=candidate division MSBL1 archaeon SCGC-AAA382N08 TaxID=1698285 RepID=A0A133VQP3_9EURY|nr:hypothetical protein AKJ56_00515 [candidate division MSBL1 archaeon SCGC-AAA382N08]
MPELPEVEIQRKYFNSTSLNKKITKITLQSEEILEKISKKKLIEKLEGEKFTETRRYGKYLFSHIDNESWLAVHFGMTGKLEFLKTSNDKPAYTKLFITFSDETHLAYTSIRKLGTLTLTPSVEKFVEKKQLGPDALDLDFKTFESILSNRRGTIKYTLMNQKIIAGIGNLYSDEILFQSKIHPKKQSNEITRENKKKLFKKLKEVLFTAIENDSYLESFPESYLIRHRNKNGNCPSCGTELTRIKVLGRSTYYCPNDQSPK